jgi:hypothetical protein
VYGSSSSGTTGSAPAPLRAGEGRGTVTEVGSVVESVLATEEVSVIIRQNTPSE